MPDITLALAAEMLERLSSRSVSAGAGSTAWAQPTR
jgi:hypothetical protein